MNITEHEMRGLLAGKCLPGDMRVNEELPAYLVRKFAELKAERDAMAAENATLISAFMPKEIPTEATDNFSDTAVLRIDGDEFHSWQWVDNQDEVIRGVLNFFKPKTPATDAYLNSMRAEVIKDFCQLVGQYGKVEPHHFNSDFADLYAKINKEIYESILDNPAVYDMESLVDWLERGVNDSRAYADMSIQHAAQPRAGEPS